MAKIKKTAQEAQDDVFRKMSADEKLEVWAGLWRLARDLGGDKLTYGHGAERSQKASGKCRQGF